MLRLGLKVGVVVVALAVVVIVLIDLGVADSMLSFEWRTSERLLITADTAKKARPSSIIINSHGTHFAYVIEEQIGKDDRYHLCLDGRDAGVYGYVWEMIFSPDGKRTAFLVSREPTGARDFYIVDGKEEQKYEFLLHPTAAFSPNGSLFGYAAMRDKQHFVVMNGIPGKGYELVWGLGQAGEAPLAFSPDGKHYGYLATRDNKTFLVIDGKEHSVEWNLEMLPVFSQDGTRWAWVNLIRTELGSGSVKLENQVIIDGQPFGPVYPEIANRPVFSPDGKRVAFGANTAREIGAKAQGTGLIVVDGKELEPRYEFVRTIVFSPDGKRLAYEAKRRGKFIVVVDGRESKDYELVRPGSLVFSPDSRRVAYHVTMNKAEYLIADGAEQGPFERILTPPAFSPDSRHLVYLAASDKKEFAVTDGTARRKYEEALVPDSGTSALRRPEFFRLEFESLQFLTRDSFGYAARRDGAYYWVEERRVRRLTAPRRDSN